MIRQYYRQICRALGLLFLLGAAAAAEQPPAKLLSPEKSAAVSWACLPSEVKAEEIVAYGMNGQKNTTVADTLRKLKARCRKGHLMGADKREIRFFRPACWGNPPQDANEQRAEEARQLAALQKKYRVIIFACNPQTL